MFIFTLLIARTHTVLSGPFQYRQHTTGDFFYLLIKPASLPWGTLHAVGIQIRFFYRVCSGQHHPMSAVTAFPLQFCTALENVLYAVIVRRVYEYSLLQLIKIYGFCEDEERT